MLKFKDFLKEGDVPVVSTQREVKANLDDPTTCDELNRYLAQVTARGFVNPYSAMVCVCKVLSTYGIVLPQMTYLPEPSGEEVFEVQQWGAHPGYAHNFNDKTNNGIETNPGIVPYQNIKTAAEINNEVLYVYFCYDMNVNGTYDTFCMVIDKEGLDTILATEGVNEAKEDHSDKAWKQDHEDAKSGKQSPSKLADKWGARGGAFVGYKERNKIHGQSEKPDSLAVDVPPTAKTWKFGKKK